MAVRFLRIIPLLFLLSTLWSACAFGEPLVLSEGLKLVTEDNRLIRIREQDEKVSEADTLIARARLLPSVNASASQAYLNHEPTARFDSGRIVTAQDVYYAYHAAVQQLIYDFKGTSSLFDASKAVLETKRLDTKRTRNIVALDFAALYFDLLESEKTIAVAEKEKENFQAHLETAGALFKEGVITKNDVLQAEVRLADAAQKLLTARNVRRINGARVNSMLTRPLSTPIEAAEPARIPSETMPLDVAGEIAEKERPELQLVDATLKSFKFEETARKAEYLPRFFLQGAYDYTENRFQVYPGLWSLGFFMNVNLFSGGSTAAEIEKVQSRRQSLIIQRKKLVDDIRLELEKYYLDLMNATERIQVTKDAIRQGEENLRINKVKYSEGIGLATDVTDAIALLALAETNYYRALYDYYRSEAAYAYATGKDLREMYR